MVLQEGRPIRVWGTAAAGESITVSAAGQTATTTGDRDGRWQVSLPALAPDPARQPFTVTVVGRNRISLSDVVLGEVWLASGQSNMEWPLVAAAGGEADVLAANLPDLRLFQVAKPAPDSLTTEPARPLPVRGQLGPRHPRRRRPVLGGGVLLRPHAAGTPWACRSGSSIAPTAAAGPRRGSAAAACGRIPG